MTFYLTYEEASKLIIVPKENKPGRDYRMAIKQSLTFAVDCRYYEYLQENVSVAEKSFAKRNYVNLILGKECNKSLNTVHYLCHIRSCDKVWLSA